MEKTFNCQVISIRIVHLIYPSQVSMKWLHWRLGAATGRVVDVTDLLRDEELLHGHLVHGGEVSLNLRTVLLMYTVNMTDNNN